jgi:hypothetical protein
MQHIDYCQDVILSIVDKKKLCQRTYESFDNTLSVYKKEMSQEFFRIIGEQNRNISINIVSIYLQIPISAELNSVESSIITKSDILVDGKIIGEYKLVFDKYGEEMIDDVFLLF